MSDNFKAVITSVITIAMITVLVLPRGDINQAQVITQLGTTLSNAMKSMLGAK